LSKLLYTLTVASFGF